MENQLYVKKVLEAITCLMDVDCDPQLVVNLLKLIIDDLHTMVD